MSDKDTVEVAAATPEVTQPFKELGLTKDEYEKIRQLLGRRPTAAELALYSVMWSEHCSYKSSKVHLRQLAPNDQQSRKLLAGIGSNAGVVDIGDGYAVTFKIESHNHPSFVEPHQGAATGVGGIVRDILAMGARPIAVMDALRFGPADAHDTARVLPGVVSGISFYGNCLGLPNIGGELVFDPCYAGNPLVNALCVGVMRHGDLKAAVAEGPGNKVRAVRVADWPGRRRRRLGPGERHLRRSRTRRQSRRWRRRQGLEEAKRAGRRPVHGKAPRRVLPRAVRERPDRGHPGPRRGRHRLRDHGAVRWR